MQKRILITTFTFPPRRDGVSHVVEAHATGLAMRGHDVTVATALVPERQNLEPAANLHVRQFKVSGSGKWLRGGGYRGDIEEYQKFIAAFDGDAIICHCWQIWSTDLAVPMFARTPAKKILVSHGVSATQLKPSLRSLYHRLTWQPYLWKMRRMVRAFDHVVLLANTKTGWRFFDRRMMDRLGYRDYSVIPNGVDLGRFADAQWKGKQFRDWLGVASSPIVLNVSHYSHAKNQEMSLRAFVEAGVGEAKLVFIGGEINSYAKRIQSLCGALLGEGWQSRVFFLEKLSTEQIAAAYCACDVFLCSSRLEVQPLVVMDAMGAGKPFVCTDVGCVSEFSGGLVVRDVRQMGHSIRSLLLQEQLRNSLGTAGRAAAESTYNWTGIVESYEALLSRMQAGAQARQGSHHRPVVRQ